MASPIDTFGEDAKTEINNALQSESPLTLKDCVFSEFKDVEVASDIYSHLLPDHAGLHVQFPVFWLHSPFKEQSNGDEQGYMILPELTPFCGMITMWFEEGFGWIIGCEVGIARTLWWDVDCMGYTEWNTIICRWYNS